MNAQKIHKNLQHAFHVKDKKLILFYFGADERKHITLETFKRGLVLLGIGTDDDVVVSSLYETYVVEQEEVVNLIYIHFFISSRFFLLFLSLSLSLYLSFFFPTT